MGFSAARARRRDSGRAGLLAQAAGCLGVVVLAGILSAAGLLIWFFQSIHDSGRDQDREARAAVAAAAERLGKRFTEADADGILTDQEIADALKQHDPWSLDRNATRTVVVVQVAAGGWAQCYAYTATRAGSVTSLQLQSCPALSPATLPQEHGTSATPWTTPELPDRT
ncbi:hypothetical protein [Streptomyces sp. NPDC086182]|uniref:hypothetical protein n=1 Tax=Streptomyces sp. NPDC086182 TaxID=3155058 RepID=UPI0034379143